MINFEGVVIESILVRSSTLEVVIFVNCWHDVQMVVRGVGVWRTYHVVELSVTVQLSQDCLGVLLLYYLDIGDVPKVQLVDYVADIQSLDLLVDHQPGEDVLVSVAAYMEVTRHLLHSERSS